MSKTILFDLDQTLGYFEQMVHIMNHCDLSCHELLTLFPEFFRPLLMEFIKGLLPYKQSGKIKSILIIQLIILNIQKKAFPNQL
jgi:hypothetical protein